MERGVDERARGAAIIEPVDARGGSAVARRTRRLTVARTTA
jgi:hypothetical protein